MLSSYNFGKDVPELGDVVLVVPWFRRLGEFMFNIENGRTRSDEKLRRTRHHMRAGVLWGLGLVFMIVGWVIVETWH